MWRLKVTVHFNSQHFLWHQYSIPLQALKLHSWLIPFSKAVIKINYLPKFHCQSPDPSKVMGCSIAKHFLKILIATPFWITSATDYFPKGVWRYQNYYHFPKKTHLQQTHPVLNLICYLLFLTKKDRGVSKSKQT